MRTPTLFCHQIKRDKLEAVKDFISLCLTEKRSEYEELLRRYDLNDTRWWFHNLNGIDYLMFTHDMGPEGFQKLKQWSKSNSAFDHWFEAQLKDLFISDSSNHQPCFFNFIIVA
ncbi:MAG: hypothetical protein A3F10_06915 [Coxiella sp. RIFCSPHIGHO2_12_FULL_42_15]|nr:MAG: hypothetical protein A3F10_06915 [Coxiella sp. RIFCSPHIGHO2_12_FULL_42_15]